MQRSIASNLHKSLICEPKRTAGKIHGLKRSSTIGFYKHILHVHVRRYTYLNDNIGMLYVCMLGRIFAICAL